MTLAEHLPSLRTSLRPYLDPDVWPLTAHWARNGELIVGGAAMSALAAAHGTPVHVLDEADVRAQCDRYLAGFGSGAVAYSAKAGLTEETGRWIAEQGLGCYVTTVADLVTALRAGFPPASVTLRGTTSVAALEAASECGAAVVVGTDSEAAAVSARATAGHRGLSPPPERVRRTATGDRRGRWPDAHVGSRRDLQGSAGAILVIRS